MKVFLIFTYFLFLTVLDVCCCEGFTLVAVSRGYSLVVVLGFLVVAATLVHHRL